MTDELEPLLGIEATDEGDDRLLVVGEEQPVAQRPFVAVLVLDGADAEWSRDVGVRLRSRPFSTPPYFM